MSDLIVCPRVYGQQLNWNASILRLVFGLSLPSWYICLQRGSESFHARSRKIKSEISWQNKFELSTWHRDLWFMLMIEWKRASLKWHKCETNYHHIVVNLRLCDANIVHTGNYVLYISIKLVCYVVDLKLITPTSPPATWNNEKSNLTNWISLFVSWLFAEGARKLLNIRFIVGCKATASLYWVRVEQTWKRSKSSKLN